MKRMYDKAEKKCCPPNIKFSFISSETHEETFAFMKDHFLPREPISICLSALDKYGQTTNNETIDENEDWLSNLMRYWSTTIIAQDSENDDKVVGAVIAGIAKKLKKDGTKEDWYNTDDVSNEELLTKWSELNIELTGIELLVMGKL